AGTSVPELVEGERRELAPDDPLAVNGARSALLLPLSRPDGAPAVLALFSKAPAHFEDWQVDVVDALSAHLSSALHAAQLRQRLEGAFDELARTRDSLLRAQNLRLASEM